MMKQTHRNLRFGPLALVPLVGFGVVAWQGANRPERLIVGKWKVSKQNRAIEFRADGTFTSVTTERQLQRANEYYVLHMKGRYRFQDRTNLHMEETCMEAASFSTLPARGLCEGASTTKSTKEENVITLNIHREVVDVVYVYPPQADFGESWQRIK
jgi:hypothetical protein